MLTCTLQMLGEVEQGVCNNRSFLIKQVSHRNQEFIKGWNFGSQIAEFCWKSLQSLLSKDVMSLYRGRLSAKFMLYVRSWQFRFQNQHRTT